MEAITAPIDPNTIRQTAAKDISRSVYSKGFIMKFEIEEKS